MSTRTSSCFKPIGTCIMRLALIEFQVKTFQTNEDVSNTDFNLFLKQEGSTFAVVQGPGQKNSGKVPTRMQLCEFDGNGPNVLQKDFDAGWTPVAATDERNDSEVDFIWGYYTGNIQGSLPNRAFVHSFSLLTK